MPKTLVVDGDNLLTIGFYGVKKMYKGIEYGGLFHIIRTLRNFFQNYNISKIVVFWDGKEGSNARKKVYPYYKQDRKDNKTEYQKNSFNFQKERTQKYLEELYVRQGIFDYCEADDCIAQYCHEATDEEIIILSSDGDLTQLINERISVFNPGSKHKRLYKQNDLYDFEHQEILIENVKIAKMLCGDKSDSIAGIKNIGSKKIVNLFPELVTTPMTLDAIRTKAELLFMENKNNKTLANLITGVTKYGILGDEFFTMIDKIVNLDNPILTEEAKDGISSLIYDYLDTENRSYKNCIRLMSEDGFFTFIPKSDDSQFNFIQPYFNLTKKEKNIKRKIKIK